MSANGVDLALMVAGAIHDAADSASAWYERTHGGGAAYYAYRLFIPQIRGKFVFTAWLDEQKKWLFGAITAGKTTKIADVRIVYGLRASFTPRAPSSTALPILVRRPLHARATGKKFTVKIALVDGRELEVRHTGNQDAWIDGRSVYPDLPSRRLELDAVLCLIDTVLAAAAATEAAPEIELDRGSRFGQLIAPLVEGLARSADQDVAGRELGYAFDELRARFLVQIDEHGQPIAPNADAQQWGQVDIDGELVIGSDSRVARVALRIPDMLRSGDEYHAVFVDALADDEIIARMRSAAAKVDADRFEEPAAFGAFVRDALSAATFTRLGADDWDLVLMKGQHQRVAIECAWLIQFEVAAYPNVSVERVDEIQLISLRERGTAWPGSIRGGEGQGIVALFQYFWRLPRLLSSLDRGLAEPA